MNTIHAQIAFEPKQAQATLERLSVLLRRTLSATQQEEVPLQEELDFVETYLGIERLRLGERFKVDLRVPPELLEARIPPFALHILVENALKHGLGSSNMEGSVGIAAAMEGSTLIIRVTDPGNGVSTHQGTGFGLENLRQRLRHPSDLRMTRTSAGFEVSFRWEQPS